MAGSIAGCCGAGAAFFFFALFFAMMSDAPSADELGPLIIDGGLDSERLL